MRALFLQITFGLVAALAFFTALLVFDTGGVSRLDGAGLAGLFTLVAMVFLSVQLILTRLSQDDGKAVRIKSRDRRR